MKMEEQHYQTLLESMRTAIGSFGLNAEVTTVAEWLDYQTKAYAQSGLTETRKLFDILYWVDRRTPGRLHDWFAEVYKYANDSHIETAVRRAFKALGGAQ